jgi:hypothetical protein
MDVRIQLVIDDPVGDRLPRCKLAQHTCEPSVRWQANYVQGEELSQGGAITFRQRPTALDVVDHV